MKKLKIVVGGFIGLYPTGGASWDYIQYPLGLMALGHDVYYVEDTMQYPVYQQNGKSWDDASDCIAYLSSTMNSFDMGQRWAYRDVVTGKCHGLTLSKVLEICNTADVFINVSCSTFMREEYLKIPNRILIDSDPMFTQIQYFNELESDKRISTKQLIETHNHHFTFGENIGSPDCKIPLLDVKWHTTRQPVCIDLWGINKAHFNNAFTSVMNWSGRHRLIFDNMEWGQKDIEFEKIREIPAYIPEVEFKVVINKPLNKESNFVAGELESLGWKLLDPHSTVASMSDYKSFIQNSAAEFSVAKETYVKSHSGWFSCRSACYLASGKPVVAQETGWSKFIPAGNGLFQFTDLKSASDAIKIIMADYTYHSNVARELANEYFDSKKVLSKMLEQIN